MKKCISFTLAAMMLVSVFSFVSCKKQNEPEEVFETPTVLTGTTWINGEGTDWVQTLIFNTENQGVQKVHNSYGDFEDAFTYEYADAKGSFTITQTDETFQFTVEGNKLSVPDKDDPNPDFAMVYVLKK